MDLKKVYLHGICIYEQEKDINETLTILEKILKKGAIVSLEKQQVYNSRIGFNGLNYVSLCDYEKYLEDKIFYLDKRKQDKCSNYNAFKYYISRSLSLAVSKDKIATEKPILIKPLEIITDKEYDYYITHPKKRFSDFKDEVQAKNAVSLEYLEYLTIPINHFTKNNKPLDYNIDMMFNFLSSIKHLLNQYNYYQKIYDLNSQEDLNDKTRIRKIIKNK